VARKLRDLNGIIEWNRSMVEFRMTCEFNLYWFSEESGPRTSKNTKNIPASIVIFPADAVSVHLLQAQHTQG